MKVQYENNFGEVRVEDVLAEFVLDDNPWVVVRDRAGRPICIPAPEYIPVVDLGELLSALRYE